jgi:4-hydroxybenzoate polyprenyltransferase
MSFDHYVCVVWSGLIRLEFPRRSNHGIDCEISPVVLFVTFRANEKLERQWFHLYLMEMAQTSVTLSARPGAASRAENVSFLLQVSRPGFWATTALFYMMPLGRGIRFDSLRFWLGLLYVLLPLGLLLYGSNDIVDTETDGMNPRKGTFLFGSRGAAEQLSALKWKIVVVQAPFLATFYFILGPRVLFWFAAILAAVFLYNASPFAWKGRPPFDVLIQSSYLLIFVLSSWINQVPQLPWPTFAFGAMFAMHSHIFGEVLDVEPDQAARRRTTATFLGRVPSKFLIAAFLAVESLLVLRYFGDAAIVGFLALGAFWFLLDATVFWRNRNYSPFEMRLFMLGWNAVALAGILWNWHNSSLTSAKHIVGTLK